MSSGLRDIFVVARNLHEYRVMLVTAQQQWDFEIKRNMVHYVHDARELSGISGARVFLCGSYFKRPDWPLIDQAIRANGHRRLLVR